MKTTVEVKLPINQLVWYSNDDNQDELRKKIQFLIAKDISVLPDDIIVTFSVMSPWG